MIASATLFTGNLGLDHVIGFALGIPYHHPFGHRGFFHSPFFALLMGVLLTTLFFRDAGVLSRRWLFFLVYFPCLTPKPWI